MLTVTRIFNLAAAHHLPTHGGKCKQFHGHNYKIEVEVRGELHSSGEESGMVMDFGRLKDVMQVAIIDRLDHSLLNETMPEWAQPPTAENMCLFIAQELITGEVKGVYHVRVWETDNSHADWRANK
jgi:6-pyruvoyltetrahydropterin/6-carboxytetrahydropterin synthase